MGGAEALTPEASEGGRVCLEVTARLVTRTPASPSCSFFIVSAVCLFFSLAPGLVVPKRDAFSVPGAAPFREQGTSVTVTMVMMQFG